MDTVNVSWLLPAGLELKLTCIRATACEQFGRRFQALMASGRGLKGREATTVAIYCQRARGKLVANAKRVELR